MRFLCTEMALNEVILVGTLLAFFIGWFKSEAMSWFHWIPALVVMFSFIEMQLGVVEFLSVVQRKLPKDIPPLAVLIPYAIGWFMPDPMSWLLWIGIVVFALCLRKATSGCIVIVVPKDEKGFPREVKTVDMADIVVQSLFTVLSVLWFMECRIQMSNAFETVCLMLLSYLHFLGAKDAALSEAQFDDRCKASRENMDETNTVRATAKTLVLKLIKAAKDGKTADAEESIDGLEKTKTFCLELTSSGNLRRPHLERLAYEYTVNTWNFNERGKVASCQEEGNALHCACRNGNAKMVSSLLQHGANDTHWFTGVKECATVSTSSPKTGLEVVFGETFRKYERPLYYACKGDHMEVAMVLLKDGTEKKCELEYAAAGASSGVLGSGMKATTLWKYATTYGPGGSLDSPSWAVVLDSKVMDELRAGADIEGKEEEKRLEAEKAVAEKAEKKRLEAEMETEKAAADAKRRAEEKEEDNKALAKIISTRLEKYSKAGLFGPFSSMSVEVLVACSPDTFKTQTLELWDTMKAKSGNGKVGAPAFTQFIYWLSVNMFSTAFANVWADFSRESSQSEFSETDALGNLEIPSVLGPPFGPPKIKITKQEVFELMTDMIDLVVPPLAPDLFRFIDTNNDGDMCKDEWIALVDLLLGAHAGGARDEASQVLLYIYIIYIYDM